MAHGNKVHDKHYHDEHDEQDEQGEQDEQDTPLGRIHHVSRICKQLQQEDLPSAKVLIL